MPPPLHGAAVMGLAAARSERLRALFDVTVVPINVNRGLGAQQKFGLGKLWASLALWFAVARAILTRRPDAMYLTANISGFALWRDLVLVLMCRVAGIKRIFHFHMKGLRPRYERSRLIRPAYRLMFDGAEVVHLSQRLYSDVAPVVPAERFHVVANGIDIVASLPRANSTPTVLFLSNLYESKGPLDLLDASRRVLARGVAHNLVFAGAGPEAHVVDRIREAGPSVSWVGAVEGTRKAALLAEADVFVFPSWYHFECQPLAVIEAMAFGKAIIASDEAAIPDLVNDGTTGLIVRGHAVDEIADSLERLLLDPQLRARLGAAAAVRYRQAFTAEKFDERLARTLRQIALPAERQPVAATS
jgi:glycosyltransferase involved in cell wall biosynthesis